MGDCYWRNHRAISFFSDITQKCQNITNWTGRVAGIRAPCSSFFSTISFKFVTGRGREKAQISSRRLVSRSCCRFIFCSPSQHKSIISCYRFLIGKSSLQSYFSEWPARWLLINWERLRVKTDCDRGTQQLFPIVKSVRGINFYQKRQFSWKTLKPPRLTFYACLFIGGTSRWVHPSSIKSMFWGCGIKIVLFVAFAFVFAVTECFQISPLRLPSALDHMWTLHHYYLAIFLEPECALDSEATRARWIIVFSKIQLAGQKYWDKTTLAG